MFAPGALAPAARALDHLFTSVTITSTNKCEHEQDETRSQGADTFHRRDLWTHERHRVRSPAAQCVEASGSSSGMRQFNNSAPDRNQLCRTMDEQPIVNKVASSEPDVVDLEALSPRQRARGVRPCSAALAGMALREDDLRAFCKEHDWSRYAGAFRIHCSADAIVPHMGIMLVATHLRPHAAFVTQAMPIDSSAPSSRASCRRSTWTLPQRPRGGEGAARCPFR